MSKLNPSTKGNSMDTTVRLAGGTGAYAAKSSNIDMLRRLVLANLLWEDIAYADGESVSEEISSLIPKCDAVEVAKLAVECREKQKLRHTPLFIAAEMTKYATHKVYVKDILPRIITRADMLCDFLAIYWKDKKHPLANCVKRGLAEAFHNFDEYQFAKYDRDAVIKLRDVLRMVHPTPRNEDEAALFKRIKERSLKTPDTWEVAISSVSADKKADEWTRLIQEKRLGGLAFLRNMANFVNNKVKRSVVEEGLKNLKGSMLLPLDYIKAAKMAEGYTREIEDAMISSYKHLPKLPGKTLFILDRSGSMGRAISSKSNFTRLDVACAMAMLASNVCEDFSLVVTAGDDWTKVHSSVAVDCPPRGFSMTQVVDRCNVGGGGIFTRQVLEWSRNHFKNDEFDRIIVFSDSQDCDLPSRQTPKPFGKYNYICDVSAEKHGINYRGVWTAEISGWSEHFLTYIAAFEGLENKFESEPMN